MQQDHGECVRVFAQCGFEPGCFELAGAIGCKRADAIGPQPKQAHGAHNAGVILVAGQEPDARRTEQAFALHVPTPAGKERVARCRQCGGVRHLAAAGERKAGAARQSEQLFQPAAANLLDHRECRTARVGGSVLIPRTGQPVGRQGCGKRAADHPAKKSAAGAAQHTAGDVCDQIVEHALGGKTVAVKSLGEPFAQRCQRHRCSDRPCLEMIQVIEGVCERTLEHGLETCFSHTGRQVFVTPNFLRPTPIAQKIGVRVGQSRIHAEHAAPAAVPSALSVVTTKFDSDLL